MFQPLFYLERIVLSFYLCNCFCLFVYLFTHPIPPSLCQLICCACGCPAAGENAGSLENAPQHLIIHPCANASTAGLSLSTPSLTALGRVFLLLT